MSFDAEFNKTPVFKSVFKRFLVSLSATFTNSLYLFFSSLEDNYVLNLEADRAALNGIFFIIGFEVNATF